MKTREDVERELGERISRAFLMKMSARSPKNSNREQLIPLLDRIFTPIWFERQRPLYIQRWRTGTKRGIKGLHPIADVLGTTLSFYLECILETLAFAQDALGVQWFIEHPIYTDRLSYPEHFDNTLFELEMLALLQQSGFELTPNFRTKGRRDVEALVTKDGCQFLLECKSLGESEETQRIQSLISQKVMGPSGWFRIEGASVKIRWPHFPTEDDVLAVYEILESWQKGQKVSKRSARFSVDIQPGKAGNDLSHPEPMDDRARETLLRVLPKLKNTKHPCLVILKCSITAGLASCRRTIVECLASNKFSQINQVLMVHKRKKDIIPQDPKAWASASSRPGFDYDMWDIPTSKPLRVAKRRIAFTSGRFGLAPPN